MEDHINVAIRIRPLNQRELRSSALAAQGLLPWAVQRETITQRTFSDGRVTNANSFTFDRVFDQKDTTIRVYDDVVKQIISSSMNGFNGTIFAYGQTSSGKTHTMYGSDTELGIIKLAVNEMFSIVEKDTDREYLIRVSFLEIYNEVLRDLLEPSKTNLKIHENAKHEIFVGDLSEHIVFNAQQVEDILLKGDRNRHIAGTNMNERSSRSHTIFRIVIESREKADSEGEAADGDDSGQPAKRQLRLSTGSLAESAEFTGAVKVSCLSLVDLAGSERVGQTGAEGQRLKEGAHINKSLLALGTVIARLSEDGGDKGHIPYRDSKLTRILQPSIGGNAKTLIICTITPSSDYIDEALSTLKFASRAKTIQNKPEVNEELRGDALLRRLKRASELEKEVAQMKEIERRKIKIEADNESLLRQLWKSQKERERLQRELEMQQSNMFVPWNTENKDLIDAQQTIRRQTWFPGLQRPLVDGNNGVCDIANAARTSVNVLEQTAEAMDTDDDCDNGDANDQEMEATGSNNGNSSSSTTVNAGIEINDLVLEKINDLEANNEQLRQQHDELTKSNKDMEDTIQRFMREYNLLLSTLNQLSVADTIPPSPVKSDIAISPQQPHELVQIRRKLRALMTTIDTSQRQCRKFRSQRPEAEFLEMELHAVRETLIQKEEQLVDVLQESDEMYSRFNEMEAKLAITEESCHGLRAELAAAKENASSALKMRDGLQKQLELELQQSADLLQTQTSNMEKRLASAESVYSAKINLLEKAIVEKSQTTESLQGQLKSAQLTTSEYEKNVASLTSQLDAAQGRISELSNQCQALSSANTEISEKDLAIEKLAAQLHDFQLQISDKSGKVEELNAELAQQIQALGLKSEECEKHVESISQLTLSVQQLEQQAVAKEAAYSADISKAKHDLETVLNTHLAEKCLLEMQIGSHTKEVDMLNTKLNTLSEHLSSSNDEKQKLSMQLSLMSDKANTIPVLADQIASLKQDIALLETSGAQLNASLLAKQDELDSANNERTLLHTKVRDLEAQNADVWERVSELTVANDELGSKLSSSEKAIAEYQDQVSLLTESINNLTSTRDELQSKVVYMEKQKSDLYAAQDLNEAANTRIDQLTERIAELESTMAEESTRVVEAEAKLAALRDVHASLGSKLDEKQQEYNRMVSEMEIQLADKDTQLNNLSEQFESTVAEHARQLDVLLTCEKSSLDSIAQLENSLESTRSQLASLKADMDETDQSKSATVALNAELSEKLERKTAAAIELESRIVALQEAVNNACIQKEQTQQQYALVKQELVDEGRRHQARIADLELNIDKAQGALAQADLAKEALVKRINESEADNDSQMEHTKALQQELDGANSRILELTREYDALVSNLKQDLSIQKKQAQEQIERISMAAAAAEESCAALQKQLDMLRIEYEAVSSRLADAENLNEALAMDLENQKTLANKLSMSAGDSERLVADIQESHRAAVVALENKVSKVEAEKDQLLTAIAETTAKLDSEILVVARLTDELSKLQEVHKGALENSSAVAALAESYKTELGNETARFQSLLAEKDNTCNQLQSLVDDSTKRNAELLTQLHNENAALDKARNLEEKLHGQISQMEMELDKQRGFLADTQKELESIIGTTNKQTRTLQNEVEQLCAELHSKAEKVDDLMQSLQKAQAEALAVSSERDRLQDECKSLALRTKDSQAQLEQKISEVKDELNSKAIVIQGLELALENTNASMAQSQQERDAKAEETIKELELRIEALVEERDQAQAAIQTLKEMMTELARVKDEDIAELEERLSQCESLLETSVKESLEKEAALGESKLSVSTHAKRADKAEAELKQVTVKHSQAIESMSREHSDIQAKLDTALATASELNFQKSASDAELQRLKLELKDVDIDFYKSIPLALVEVMDSMMSLPGCEGLANTISEGNKGLSSNSDLLQAIRRLSLAAASAASSVADRKSETDNSNSLQLEQEITRLRTLNEKLEKKNLALKDMYKSDMTNLHAKEEAQRQCAEKLRTDVGEHLYRVKEMEQELVKAKDELEKQLQQRSVLEETVERLTAEVAAAVLAAKKEMPHPQVESATEPVSPQNIDSQSPTPQKATMTRLASQLTTPMKTSNKRAHLSAKEAGDMSPAALLSPISSSALNARANSVQDDVSAERYPLRKRTPAAGTSSAEKSLESVAAKPEAARARSSYGDRRRIRRNQPPPRKDGLEEQAAEQCVQQ
ncbi:hypothetical protein GGI25_003217 [Coemansia spiralis]|uniref:Kinesin motor domain-containing protein n=2 Tax=Coemansia TaxID=4863 RepID=A0A9W8G8P1_9FUNG|nr:hypothetical protein EDC05_003212 [Coemansia umbellata]KAJ2621907.1 hypothetical protein GGI26_003750 [Coemansia sp. RSA 1358]KAJ2677462.1 hypothetical protein GGI25_003217 [Coemansia spiralis]